MADASVPTLEYADRRTRTRRWVAVPLAAVPLFTWAALAMLVMAAAAVSVAPVAWAVEVCRGFPGPIDDN